MTLGRVLAVLDAAMCSVLTPCSVCSGQTLAIVWVTDGSPASIDWKRRVEKRKERVTGRCVWGREGMIVCPTLHKTQVTPH